MYVKDLMTAHPITVPLDMPVIEAKQLMARMRFRHLLVVDGTRLAGIVTDRDIKLNMPSPATSLSVWEVNYLLARLTVGSVMATPVITVEAGREAGEAARVMLDHKIGALPVLDGGDIVGILTESDFVRVFATRAAYTTV